MTNDYEWTLMCRACCKPFFKEHPLALTYRELFERMYPERYRAMREYNFLNLHTIEWAYHEWQLKDDLLVIGESK